MHRNLAICCGLILITLAAFWQVGFLDFVNLDDPGYVYENVRVQKGLTWDNLTWAMTTSDQANWHPLTWLSLMLDAQMFGVKNSTPYHITNLLFHLGNTILLFVLLLKMTGRTWPSAMVAALFAVHPLHVEPVVWITARKDALSTLFLFLSMAAYIGYVRRPNVARYLLVCILMALGLMAKSTLLTLPAVFLLLDYWPLCRMSVGRPKESPTSKRSSGHRGGKRATEASPSETQPASRTLGWLVLEKAPMFGISAALGAISYLVNLQQGALPAFEHVSLASRVGTALVTYVTYMFMMVWPVNLAPAYPAMQIESIGHIVAAAAFLLAVTLTVGWGTWKGRKYLAVGWLWYLGMLVPMIGLIRVGFGTMADRFTYVPMIGLFILIVWAVADLSARWSRPERILAPIAGVILVACVGTSMHQVSLWKDSETICRHTVRVTENNDLALLNLGTALVLKGQKDEAFACFQEALHVNPRNPSAQYNMASQCKSRGQIKEAAEHYQAAIKYYAAYPWADRERAWACNDLARLLSEQGQHDAAMTFYQKAAEISPGDFKLQNNLGYALARSGKTNDAIGHYRKALEINPQYAVAHRNLAEAIGGVSDEALFHYDEAIRLRPEFAEAHRDLGFALMARGNNRDAQTQFEEAIRITPNNGKAHVGMAIVCGKLGNVDAAIEHWREVLKLTPSDADASLELGMLLLKTGEIQEAADQYTHALTARPLQAHRALAEIRASQGKPDKAMEHWREILKLEPKDADAADSLGGFLLQQGKVAEAAELFRTAIEAQPKRTEARGHLAAALAVQQQIKPALEQWREMLRLEPDNVIALSSIAWVLATSSDASLRNGAEAVKQAEQAAKFTRNENPAILDTLAATYAEAGRFPDAVKMAETAQQLAVKQGNKGLAKRIETRAALYRSSKPAHEGVESNSPKPQKSIP